MNQPANSQPQQSSGPLDFLNLPKPDVSKLPQYQKARENSGLPLTPTSLPQPQAQAAQAPVQPEPISHPPANPEPATEEPATVDLPDLDFENENTAEPASEESAETPSEPEAQATEPDIEITEEDNKTLNFKKVTKALSHTKKKFTELEQKLQKIEKENEKLKNGETIPDVVETLRTENERLARYEKLHNLKSSQEYFENFVKPLDELTGKLGTLGKDYEIPEEVLSEAVGIKSKAELNRFLSDHFDTVGAVEAKQIIDQIRDVKSRALKAEEEPAKALQNLQQEQQAIRQNVNSQRRALLNDTAKQSYGEVLAELQKEAKYEGLVHRPNNPEHNEKFVKQITSRAGLEYAKMVKEINRCIETGEAPSKDLLKALSKMTLISHNAAIEAGQNKFLKQHLTTQQRQMQDLNSMLRPSSSPVQVSRSAPQKSAPDSPKAAADVILKSIGL